MEMSRQKMYFEWELPRTVVEMVRAICADYDRRERAIKHAKIADDVRAKYLELNAIIDGAMEDIEFGIRKSMLNDVISNRGYGKSASQMMLSKNAYYRRKRKLIHDIAANLSLL